MILIFDLDQLFGDLPELCLERASNFYVANGQTGGTPESKSTKSSLNPPRGHTVAAW